MTPKQLFQLDRMPKCSEKKVFSGYPSNPSFDVYSNAVHHPGYHQTVIFYSQVCNMTRHFVILELCICSALLFVSAL